LKPNRKILALRVNHSVYLMVNKSKLERDKLRTAEKCAAKNLKRKTQGKEEVTCRCWREFWAYTVGEPTALLDTMKVRTSAEQMELHMRKRGYFEARVDPILRFSQDSSSCMVDFHLNAGEPYITQKRNATGGRCFEYGAR